LPGSVHNAFLIYLCHIRFSSKLNVNLNAFDAFAGETTLLTGWRRLLEIKRKPFANRAKAFRRSVKAFGRQSKPFRRTAKTFGASA
jgi:hypothetical protein